MIFEEVGLHGSAFEIHFSLRGKSLKLLFGDIRNPDFFFG